MVNASLISQFRENVVSFNFRANTLKITPRAEHCLKLLTAITWAYLDTLTIVSTYYNHYGDCKTKGDAATHYIESIKHD